MPEIIEAVGFALIVLAAFLVNPALGFLAAGLALVAAGNFFGTRKPK